MITPEQLASKYPHFITLAPDGALEIFLDHHMLSTLRLCEAKFTEEHLAQYPGTNEYGLQGTTKRYWSLEFGQLLHECLEYYYKSFKETNEAPNLEKWLAQAKQLWYNYDMEHFKPTDYKLVKDIKGDFKKYYNLGGFEGFARLLVEYYAFYMNQRMRVVATEVSFGRGKEVYLGEIRYPIFTFWEGPEGQSDVIVKTWQPIKVYLSGRIDLLVDNGYKIGPVDHKHTAKFDGYESDDFNPQEGITGYIYAINCILQTLFPESPYKICRDGWIFHISSGGDSPRFKSTPINKTPQQLEDFRLRQLSSVRRLLDLLFGNRVADWNTYACNNIYNSACPFRELHRQPLEQRDGIIKQFYEIREPWQPHKPPAAKQREKADTVQTLPASLSDTGEPNNQL